MPKNNAISSVWNDFKPLMGWIKTVSIFSGLFFETSSISVPPSALKTKAIPEFFLSMVRDK